MDLEKYLIGFCSFTLGVLSGYILMGMDMPRNIEAKIFQREGKPAVIRLYKPGRGGMLVQNEEKRFILMQKQLSGKSK